MSGLYHRALEIYRRTVGLHLVAQGGEAPEIEEVSPEERAKILRQIDQVISRNRLKLRPETFAVSAKRSGAALPVLLNVLTAAVVAAVIVVFSFLFNRQEEALASGAGTILSAESKLIQALQEESEAQLQQKDQEIILFQQELQATLDRQRRLESETEAAIREREEQLEAEFRQALETERQRLIEQGLAAAAVEERLKSFETEKRSALEAEFEAFRRQAAEQAAEQEAAIAELAAEYQQNLRQAQQERSSLQEQLRQREAELQQQYQQQARELESDRTRIAEQLSRLQEKQRQEQLVLDQILSAYEAVNRLLAAGDHVQALQQLESMKAYLGQEPARSLAGIQKRLPVELFIIDSLENLIRSQPAPGDQEPDSVLVADNRLAALKEGVDRGNRRLAEGDLFGARTEYLAALGEIPEARDGYDRLEEIESAETAQTRRAVEETLGRARSDYQNGRLQASLDRYRQALSVLLRDSATAERLVDQVAEAGYRLKAAEELLELERARQAEEKRRALRVRLADLEDRYRRQRRAAGLTSLTDPETLAALLEAKLLVWEIISSEPVSSRYPDLYDTMERYLDTFGEQRLLEGRYGAVEDILAVTAAVLGTTEPGGLSDLWSRYGYTDREDLLLRLMDRLELLLE